MNKFILPVLLVILTIAAQAQPLDRSKKPKPGPAPEVTLGKTDSFTLENGMKVFVVENHKLPTVACGIELDIKPALEGEMAGYRGMMTELLLSGTSTRSKDRLNEEIEDMGASINVSDQGLSGSGLKKYQDKIFELMADIAMNAVIKKDELDKAKEKALSELESQKNDPDAMVSNVSAVVNFGKKHPYGEIPTEETINNITAERCNGYYHTYFRPNVAYMAIVGDVTLAEIKPLITRYFGKWQRMDVPQTNYEIEGLGAKQTQVDFVPRTAAVQSVVSVTYPIDLKRGDPDIIRARVANTVLGASSQGLLFLDLREKHGWTYGAYSSITDDEIGGTFLAEVKCRNAVTDSAVAAILADMATLQKEKISDSAVQNAISYLSGSFAIALENPALVAQFAINIVRYHMPADFYKNYLKNLQEINAGDIVEMARKYFLPDHANIVVAGSKDEVAEKLAKFSADGKINYYDYSGNRIKPAEMMAAPEGMTADKVLNNYVKALGGEKAIAAVKDIRITGTSAIRGMSLTITEIKKNPNMWTKFVEMNNSGMKMTVQKMAFNGKKGYQEMRGQKQDMTGNDLEEIAAQADMYKCLHTAKNGVKHTLKGIEPVNGSNAYVIEVIDAKGKKSMEYYDAESGLLVKNMQGEGENAEISEFADYREVPGSTRFKIPYKVTESAGGQSFEETVTSVEVNKGVPDSDFN